MKRFVLILCACLITACSNLTNEDSYKQIFTNNSSTDISIIVNSTSYELSSGEEETVYVPVGIGDNYLSSVSVEISKENYPRVSMAYKCTAYKTWHYTITDTAPVAYTLINTNSYQVYVTNPYMGETYTEDADGEPEGITVPAGEAVTVNVYNNYTKFSAVYKNATPSCAAETALQGKEAEIKIVT